MKALTVTIAIIAVYIAYQQYKTIKNNLRLGLFDKRFKVYKGLQKLIAIIENNQTIELEFKEIIKFRRLSVDGRFLFDDEIQEYLDTVYKKALRLRAVNRRYQPLPLGEERSKLVIEEAEFLDWFTKQFEQSDKFDKYLKFKEEKTIVDEVIEQIVNPIIAMIR